MSVNYGAKRTVVGAHYGLRDWLVQRFTGGLMAVFTLIVLARVLFAQGPIGYDLWAGVFAPQWMKALTFAVIVALIVGLLGWQFLGPQASTEPTLAPTAPATTAPASPTGSPEPTVVRGSPSAQPTTSSPVTGAASVSRPSSAPRTEPARSPSPACLTVPVLPPRCSARWPTRTSTWT